MNDAEATTDTAARRQRTMTLLWGREQRPGRGPKPSLTLERVVAAAITVADAEGLGAVSMQRVGAELGVTKMAMYRYVPGKAELTSLMVDSAMGPPPAVDSFDGDWRARLRDWSGRMWDRFVAHPWILGATIGLRPIGPCELGWMDSGVAALTGTGLNGAERLDTVELVAGHIRSLAQQTLSVSTLSTPLTESEFLDQLFTALADHADRFPALREAMMDGAMADGRDQALEYGIERILDGVAVLIEQRAG